MAHGVDMAGEVDLDVVLLEQRQEAVQTVVPAPREEVPRMVADEEPPRDAGVPGRGGQLPLQEVQLLAPEPLQEAGALASRRRLRRAAQREHRRVGPGVRAAAALDALLGGVRHVRVDGEELDLVRAEVHHLRPVEERHDPAPGLLLGPRPLVLRVVVKLRGGPRPAEHATQYAFLVLGAAEEVRRAAVAAVVVVAEHGEPRHVEGRVAVHALEGRPPMPMVCAVHAVEVEVVAHVNDPADWFLLCNFQHLLRHPLLRVLLAQPLFSVWLAALGLLLARTRVVHAAAVDAHRLVRLRAPVPHGEEVNDLTWIPDAPSSLRGILREGPRDAFAADIAGNRGEDADQDNSTQHS
mmetsp:Transcript_111351/g.325716  ORF Transcript_111351/g.325716 Transcript_111351/m.325716 type:complete len:352 (+) Transcript_111351:570-1625(+)